MSFLFTTVTDLERDADVLRRRRYGMIEMARGRLVGIHLRPWPKLVSLPEIIWIGTPFHRKTDGDRCWLYYNQPFRHRNFLALPYVVSTAKGSLASFHGALIILDEIARIKRSDAILCDATNQRISDRLFKRWGWEPHLPNSRRRHFIKRFYGEYPESGWEKFV